MLKRCVERVALRGRGWGRGHYLVGSKCASKGSVKSVSSVREKPPQRVVCVLSHRVGAFYFSQKDTEEQNTQYFTETLSQPISQSVTANISWNVLWILYAGGVLWARNVRQKPPWTLCALWEKKRPHRVSQLFFFSQRNTDEQNTQHSTETLSQPISQNLTAVFGSNVLWILYAEGLLWARNVRQKRSVKSVSSVRDNTPQRIACVSSHRVGEFSFSQNYTEEQNTQRPTETLSQPISQSLTANFS